MHGSGFRALSWLLAAALLSATCLQAQQGGLKIVVLNGDGGINNIEGRVGVEPIVEVRGADGKPASGAVVTFRSPPSGPSVTFFGATRTSTITADEAGRAQATGMLPNTESGAFYIDADGARIAPMGADADASEAPLFRVRAVGSLKQKPGCPDVSVRGLPADRLEQLCRGECYNPGDERYLITRIEVVRIRPQISVAESVDTLIEDVWRTLPCDDQGLGCEVEFTDPEFETNARDTLYYVRAIQEPTGQVNGDNLRCERDASGQCIEVTPCFGDYRTDMSDDCIVNVEHRAWSSPIYLGFAEAAPPVTPPADQRP